MTAALQASSGVTAELAEFVVATSCDRLPASVVHATKRLILDTMSCAIGAVDTAPGRLLLEYKRSAGGRADSTLLASGTKVPCGSAAYAHSQLANVLDADEVTLWMHSAAAVVMPAIAAAEFSGADGASLVAAVATGFELAARVGMSLPTFRVDPATGLLRSPGADSIGFSWASYGAAAAVGKLLDLDAATIAEAFGIAQVSMPVHGALSYVGHSEPWHKYAMFAAIGEAGVNAAMLAARGFRADGRLFDAGSTFFRAMNAADSDRAVMLDGLGSRWAVESTSLKPWPGSRLMHTALGAFTDLVAEHQLRPDDIRSVTVVVPPWPIIEWQASKVECTDRFQIMSSLPYLMSMIAYGVPAGPAWWSEAAFGNPAMRAFAQRVTARVDPDLNEVFLADLRAGLQFNVSRVPVQVRIETADAILTRYVERAHGDPADPSTAMTDAELAAKSEEFTRDVLPAGAGQQLVAAAFSLDKAGNLDALMGPCTDHA